MMKENEKTTIFDLFWIFMISAMTGWIYEEFCEVVVRRVGWVNRGFLWGPYLPVYGFGGAFIFLIFRKFAKKKRRLGKLNMTPVYTFFLIAVGATALELLTSYLMEWTLGYWMWSYGLYKIQFQGRIALATSLLFGLIGVLALYFFFPFMLKLYRKIPKKVRIPLTVCLFLFIMTDLVIRVVRIVRG